MVLCRSNNQLFCPIRSCAVNATPEEIVRQRWILRMIGPLGYPKGLLAVEKDLASLPHYNSLFNPNRRLDLLSYAPAKDRGLIPLLLVECKAKSADRSAEMQVFGYNEVVQARFMCVICDEEAKTFWWDSGKLTSVPFLPTYAQLLKSC